MKGAEYRIGTIIEAAAAVELKLFNVCSFKTPLLPGQAPTKGQYISEWIDEVFVSPKIWTKYCKDFCPVLCHTTGQKS
jgi:hypothetical protein